MPTFKDHFSGHASEYSNARPTYPRRLFEFLAQLVSEREAAWDCGTGNGQAAIALSKYFETVFATDASPDQLAQADRKPGVVYLAVPAEGSTLEVDSIDLITVAQALHWFDFDRFFAEVRRVAKPGAAIAAWAYELAKVTPAIDEIVSAFFGELHSFWPPERRFVEERYRDIPFPFETIEAPEFSMSASWECADMLAYFRTWSAVRRCAAATGVDPVGEIEAPLAGAWGAAAREVRWPLILKVGRLR